MATPGFESTTHLGLLGHDLRTEILWLFNHPRHWTLEEHSCRRQSCQADTRHYDEHVHSEKGVEHSVTQPCATGAGIQFGLSLSEALQQLMKLLKFRVIFH